MITVATAHSELEGGAGENAGFQLVVIDGPDMGRAAALTERPCHVGTDPECELALTDDRVSRRHLRVAHRHGRFEVEDLESLNGTIYQGSRLTRAELPAGATFKLGKTFLRIQGLPRSLNLAPSRSRRFGELVAESLAMRELFAVLELAARSDATVLIEGETGTGKELAARAVHDAQPARGGPVRGARLRGAAGGADRERAVRPREGRVHRRDRGARRRVRAAEGGTLFLDELGELPLSTQAQARCARSRSARCCRWAPTASSRSTSDSIAAAHENLAACVAEGSFRARPLLSVEVVRVVIPPLRARREDLAAMTAELLRRHGFDAGTVDGPNLEPAVRARLAR